MLCQCRELNRLDGDQAAAYVSAHLTLVERGRTSDASEDYVCRHTSEEWVLDFPLRHWAEDHRGRPRLRKLPLAPGEAIDALD